MCKAFIPFVLCVILQGESQWFWGVYEVQETDQCPEIWSESDPQQTIHTLVVTNNQQS